MSYDVDLVVDLGGEEPHGLCSFNYTSNMGYALKHGRLRMHEGWPKPGFLLHGANAGKAAEALAECIALILQDKESLVELEPGNGWGSVDTLVDWLQRIMNACMEAPKAYIQVSV